ncbi:MAG: sugar transferase, partial [bacterium]
KRAAVRFVALVVADLAAFGLMRELIRAVREGALVGGWFSQQVQAALPAGYMNGWQFASALFLGLLVLGNYGPGDRRRDPTRLFLASALAAALPLWTMLWARGPEVVLVQYGLTVVLVWLGVVAERLAIDRIIARVRNPERDAADTLFVGRTADCNVAAASPVFGGGKDYRPIGFVDLQSPAATGALGHIGDLSLLLAASGAEVVVICGLLTDQQFEQAVDASLTAGCHVLSVPRAAQVAGVHPTTVWRQGQPLVELTRPVVKASALYVKRIADFFAASVGLLILTPVFLVIAALIKLDGPGPVFFASSRWGQGGKAIRIWKFRTMVDGARNLLDNDPRLKAEYAKDVKLRTDPRVTRVGELLRRLSLDELPQLFNVLRGEMSLVGPRPKLWGEEDRYGPLFGIVLGVPPGMTGLWQVSGRNNLSYEERIALDVDYVRRCSLLLDARILLQTLPAVLGGRGAH